MTELRIPTGQVNSWQPSSIIKINGNEYLYLYIKGITYLVDRNLDRYMIEGVNDKGTLFRQQKRLTQ